ncbi:MAG TPA: hypothetical protein VF132_06055 [Rudaea sp.]
MRISILSLLAATLMLAACSNPLPADKSAYAGDWHANGFFLSITPDGYVHYKRVGAVSKTINAPLKRFEGDNFVVGVGPMSTTFIVSAVPHADGDVWKMTVDGVELRKLP